MATWHINPAGNDTTGDGSAAAPWATLAKAVAGSGAGDTIIFQNGTYTLATGNGMDSFKSDRIYEGESIGGAIIDGAGGNVYIGMGSGAVGMEVRNLTFQNIVRTSVNWISIFGMNAAGGRVTFRNCVFHDMLVMANAVSGVGGGIFGSSHIAGGFQSNYRFYGCLFYDITKNGNGGYFTCAWSTGGPNHYALYNCTIYIEPQAAASLVAKIIAGEFNNASEHTLKNVIVANDSGYTVSLTPSLSNYVRDFSHCDFHNVADTQSPTSSLAEDPLFVDAAGLDFNLRPTSPCIGTGVLI